MLEVKATVLPHQLVRFLTVEAWSIAAQLIVGVITVFVLLSAADVPFGVVIVWALSGIRSGQTDPSIRMCALVLTILVGTLTLVIFCVRVYLMYTWARTQQWSGAIV